MTAKGFLSVSLDPKLVVISIGHKAKFLEKVSQSGRYTVNILAENHEHYSRHFAGSPDGEVQFGQLADLPVLNEVVAQHVEGDHTLFIAEVIDLNVTDKNQLLLYSGKYRTLEELAAIES